MSSKPDKSSIEENEKIKTQIDASIGMARSLISSWLPPLKEGEKLEDGEDDDTVNNYSTGRPDRLGLGAKFLSHAEAMRHNQDGTPSKQELLLKNKILNQNKKTAAQPIGKRYRPQDQDDSDSEEESRSTTVGVRQKKTKTKAATATATATTSTNTKKIGNQGDFLSMYLNERAGKKKNKK